MAKYEGNWSGYEDVKKDYHYVELPPEKDILFAGYETPDYDGYAFILFQKDGKLYENNDSHCSCYGLENWSPEETTLEALKMRKKSWISWDNLQNVLDEYEATIAS